MKRNPKDDIGKNIWGRGHRKYGKVLDVIDVLSNQGYAKAYLVAWEDGVTRKNRVDETKYLGNGDLMLL